MNYLRIVLLLCIALLLTHCISYDLSRRVVQQGVLLPQDKVDKLKVGMSKQDVLHILGSTLIYDPFTSNRLDYAYTYQKNNRTPIIKYVALTFSNDKLIEIQRNK